VTGRIEHAAALDRPAEAVAAFLKQLIGTGTARDAVSGLPFGHPVHPILVTVPIGSWVGASALDLTGADGKAARRLVGLGIATAVPAALTGANDWITTTGAERRVGLVHALLNDAALGLFFASWLARGRGHCVRGTLLSLAGLATAGTAGWLGGHLAFALGVGVDTTAFQHLPAEWTDVAAEANVREGEALRADADGVPILLTRVGGTVTAVADRCTHRGGPLDQGELSDGCVTCPWHGSRFRLADGSVVAGPATRPVQTLKVRVHAGRIDVRREDEQRALRTRRWVAEDHGDGATVAIRRGRLGSRDA